MTNLISPLLKKRCRDFKISLFLQNILTLNIKTKKDNRYKGYKCILDVSFEVEKGKKNKNKNTQTQWFSGTPSHHSKLTYTQDELLGCGRSVSTQHHAPFLSVMSYLCKAEFSVAAVIKSTVQTSAWNRK